MKDLLHEEIEPGDFLIRTSKIGNNNGRLLLYVFRGTYTPTGMLRIFEFYGLDRDTNLKPILLHCHVHNENVLKISKEKFIKLIDDLAIQFTREQHKELIKEKLLETSENIKQKFI